MSNSDVVIRVEGLGKKYSLHHEKAERYTALRDVVARQAKAAGRFLNPFTLAGQLRMAQREAAAERAESEEEFWALRDVSFEIRQGDRVGIIGRNGAGKSTLLKILSRITEPTMGRVEIRGRVASLLEVGTGFHPELTGRENIYLNGAILGMTRREIRAKFDEIVDFAEVEKFLDTPVKRYSSGMYVRLAFAVAAHLEPEILVVDEVLAVGDASFQNKCLGKLRNVSHQGGRTVLFVSHNMTALSNLCTTAICLTSGKVSCSGKIATVLSHYRLMGSSTLEWCGGHLSTELHVFRSWVRSLGPDGSFDTMAQLEIGIAMEVLQPITGLVIGFNLVSGYGSLLAHILYDDHEITPPPQIGKGPLTVRTIIPANTLAKGDYEIEFDVGIWGIRRILNQEANLSFSLVRTHGLGSRFPEPETPSATSLFRPNWTTVLTREGK